MMASDREILQRSGLVDMQQASDSMSLCQRLAGAQRELEDKLGVQREPTPWQRLVEGPAKAAKGGPPVELEDNWRHRSVKMRCGTCMWFVLKPGPENTERIGRCRESSPTIKGWPAIYPSDWCGAHKLDETKL